MAAAEKEAMLTGRLKELTKLHRRNSPEYERLKLVLTMFPGDEQLIAYFEDTKVRRGARCVIHDALVAELTEMLGDKNVVVK